MHRFRTSFVLFCPSRAIRANRFNREVTLINLLQLEKFLIFTSSAFDSVKAQTISSLRPSVFALPRVQLFPDTTLLPVIEETLDHVSIDHSAQIPRYLEIQYLPHFALLLRVFNRKDSSYSECLQLSLKRMACNLWLGCGSMLTILLSVR